MAIARVKNFFSEVRTELAKCSWPWDPKEKGFRRYKELFDSTLVVIIAMLLLGGYVASIGEIQADFADMPYEKRFVLAEESDVRCPVEASADQMRSEIERTIHGKNTLGGILEIVALNVPVGLGSFAQWDKRLEAKLAMAVMSVQAIKGVEVGDAFANARL